MAWTDQLRAASFRGVGFKVEAHDAQGGRRTVTHEFPGRDTPYVEDMGRRAKAFSVEAYVIGDDYMQRRDALMRACDEAGSGELVHPYLGTVKVNCNGWSLRESKGEGRMARFTLSFIESGEADHPNESLDSIAQAASAADAAKAASIGDFAGNFSIDGLPEFAIGDATRVITSAASKIRAIGEGVTGVAADKAGFLGMVASFTSELSSLISSPHGLASSVFALIETASSLFDAPFDAARSLSSLFSFGDDEEPVRETTATRQRQADNRAAIIGLVQQAAVIQVSRVAPAADYATVEDAEGVRASIAEQLDDVMESPATPDATYSALQALRTAVVRGVPPESVSLPKLVTVTPQITLPSLALAYEIYEDASRDAEIVTRNRVAHPGFVPGGQSLKVVADA